ncbi:MAG: nucleotidyltransferase [Bacteroidia bacterium]|nr:MAG: nucleotidyltransferase [Bacteroidia bacterium]
MIDLGKHIVFSHDPLLVVLEKLNNVPENLTLFVVDSDNRMIGSLTDGDIRRGLIKGLPVSGSAEMFMSAMFSYMNGNSYSIEEITLIKKKGVKLLPILDDNMKIKSVIDFSRVVTRLPVDAFIMAGGRGERLMPLTANTPKPLLEIGGKPIIDHIIGRLLKYGIEEYIISVRYLGEKIEEYIGDGSKHGISVEFIREVNPLGTIGSLSLVREFRNRNVLLMNADIFTNIDFEDFYRTFVNEKADFAIASIPYNVDVPYAILIPGENNSIGGLTEKPRYSYYANAGIYLMKRELADLLQDGERCDAPDFIAKIISSGKRVIRYPIIGYWIDIGKHDDFVKASEFASHLME